MKFTMNRDRVVVSRYGHSVRFIKGESTHVPPEMYEDVQAVGAVPDEEFGEAKGPQGSIEPNDPLRRRAAMGQAISNLMIANVRGEFTAGGAPHAAVMARELGWSPSDQEAKEAWAEFNNKGNANEAVVTIKTEGADVVKADAKVDSAKADAAKADAAKAATPTTTKK